MNDVQQNFAPLTIYQVDQVRKKIAHPHGAVTHALLLLLDGQTPWYLDVIQDPKAKQRQQIVALVDGRVVVVRVAKGVASARTWPLIPHLRALTVEHMEWLQSEHEYEAPPGLVQWSAEFGPDDLTLLIPGNRHCSMDERDAARVVVSRLLQMMADPDAGRARAPATTGDE
jgi:hypothetical protein